MRSIKPSTEVGLVGQCKCSLIIKSVQSVHGGQVRKRKEDKTLISFYVLLSFLVCINTSDKVQTGATLF